MRTSRTGEAAGAHRCPWDDRRDAGGTGACVCARDARELRARARRRARAKRRRQSSFDSPSRSRRASARYASSTARASRSRAREDFRPGGEGSALGIRLPDGLERRRLYRDLSRHLGRLASGLRRLRLHRRGCRRARRPRACRSFSTTRRPALRPRWRPASQGFSLTPRPPWPSGALVFALFVFGPALRQAGAAGDRWRAAAEAFSRRFAAVMRIAVAVGLAAGALGIVCQGAIAGGTVRLGRDRRDGDRRRSRDAIRHRLGPPRAGMGAPRARDDPTVANFGHPSDENGDSSGSRDRARGRLDRHCAGARRACIHLHPGLASHPLDDCARRGDVRVGRAASRLLVFGVRAATRELEPEDRTRLLSATLARFSLIALGAVAALAATGTIQAISYLESVSDLWDTGFGRAVSAKILLFGVLIAVGVVHRRRSLPQLREAADGRPRRRAGVGRSPSGRSAQRSRCSPRFSPPPRSSRASRRQAPWRRALRARPPISVPRDST